MSEEWEGWAGELLFFIMSHVEVFDILKQYIYYVKIKIKLKKKKTNQKLWSFWTWSLGWLSPCWSRAQTRKHCPRSPSLPNGKSCPSALQDISGARSPGEEVVQGIEGAPVMTSKFLSNFVFHFFPKLNNLSFTLPCFRRCH